MHAAEVTAWIGVGANLGEAEASCRLASQWVIELPQVRPMAISALYRTEPVGPVAEQPWFINAVVGVRTTRSPQELLEQLHGLEYRMGRRRDSEASRWGPRLLDLDLLDYGGQVHRQAPLLLPHPQMHARRFVLAPLGQVAPHWVHPVSGKTIDTLLEEADDNAKVEMLATTAPTFF